MRLIQLAKESGLITHPQELRKVARQVVKYAPASSDVTEHQAISALKRATGTSSLKELVAKIGNSEASADALEPQASETTAQQASPAVSDDSSESFEEEEL
jgi:hypothetical protein